MLESGLSVGFNVTLILKTNPYSPDIEVLRKAAQILLSGGLVAFPTETVYGLGAVAFYENAARRIFQAKERPPDNPLIVHIAELDMLEDVAVNIPEDAYKLIRVFWPGPLTLILPKHPRVPPVVSGGLNTVAVRMPAHPVALGLIRETGYPIAAPSANLAGRPSPISAEHVIRDLYGRVDAIIDAGETLYGVESTIVNILAKPPVLLRPGAYPVEQIEAVLGVKLEIPAFARGFGEAPVALAPGTKYRHYAPETPVILVEPVSGLENMVNRVKLIAEELLKDHKKVCIAASRETMKEYLELANKGVVVIDMGSRSNLFEVARRLFKVLRSFDDISCDVSIVEGFEEKGLGLTIMNRLRKASTSKVLA